ncbi:hypothetical protein [uncultured Enterovirga sp.]|uniref:hypothetical protein n=1 Tax=uncultured Enterovirga sp. TaxID=2026352 RepID=UPI0035CC02C6
MQLIGPKRDYGSGTDVTFSDLPPGRYDVSGSAEKNIEQVVHLGRDVVLEWDFTAP